MSWVEPRKMLQLDWSVASRRMALPARIPSHPYCHAKARTIQPAQNRCPAPPAFRSAYRPSAVRDIAAAPPSDVPGTPGTAPDNPSRQKGQEADEPRRGTWREHLRDRTDPPGLTWTKCVPPAHRARG